VFSATAQRGGKITKSHAATPGVLVWQVNTVKMDGSCGAGKTEACQPLNRAALLLVRARALGMRTMWSNVTVLMALKRARSYLYGA